MNTNQAESQEQRAARQKSLSKGPGRLTLFSGKLTTREHALMMFTACCRGAQTALLRARHAVGLSRVHHLEDARGEGKMARAWYEQVEALKTEALTSGSGVAA